MARRAITGPAAAPAIQAFEDEDGVVESEILVGSNVDNAETEDPGLGAPVGPVSRGEVVGIEADVPKLR